jgi:histidine triad (HIT) family protein
MESNRATAFLDVNPAGQGHTLVIPRSHATDIWGLTEEDADEVWRLTRRVAHRLREGLEPEGLTLFQANGSAGWQDVFHVHIHLVPRWAGDRLIKPWEGAPGDPSRLDQLATPVGPSRFVSPTEATQIALPVSCHIRCRMSIPVCCGRSRPQLSRTPC